MLEFKQSGQNSCTSIVQSQSMANKLQLFSVHNYMNNCDQLDEIQGQLNSSCLQGSIPKWHKCVSHANFEPQNLQIHMKNCTYSVFETNTHGSLNKIPKEPAGNFWHTPLGGRTETDVKPIVNLTNTCGTSFLSKSNCQVTNSDHEKDYYHTYDQFNVKPKTLFTTRYNSQGTESAGHTLNKPDLD